MAVDTLDINQIAVILSQLIQNYNELAQNWFDVFYNPEQMDVTLKFFDPDGNLQTYTLPNRAKDFRYVMNGVGDPEGQINAKVGTMFLDTQGGDIYLKRTGEGNTGWQRVMSMTEVYSNGKGSPEGVVTGKKGDMYVDLDSGMLYTKTTATGATGWSLAGAGGKADQTYVDRRFDEVDDNLAVLNAEINEGVVHKKGAPETITSDKTFNSNITITGSTNMSGATTISGATNISGTLNVTNQATFTKVINGTAYRALSADIAEYYSADLLCRRSAAQPAPASGSSEYLWIGPDVCLPDDWCDPFGTGTYDSTLSDRDYAAPVYSGGCWSAGCMGGAQAGVCSDHRHHPGFDDRCYGCERNGDAGHSAARSGKEGEDR